MTLRGKIPSKKIRYVEESTRDARGRVHGATLKYRGQWIEEYPEREERTTRRYVVVSVADRHCQMIHLEIR